MTPRDAATVCLVRAAHRGPEVLMVQRAESSSFMGGAWVFPGGTVDDSDADPEARAAVRTTEDALASLRLAALRELVEETGIWLTVDGARVTDKRPSGAAIFTQVPALDGDALRYFANWITPAPMPVRFDTKFFIAEVSRRIEALVDGKETVDTAWIDPADALERADTGDWLVAFPARTMLSMFCGHDSVGSLLSSLPDPAEVVPVEPRLAVTDDAVRILLPSDHGFDEAGAYQDDPSLLARAMAVAEAGGEVPPELRRA